MIYSRMTSARAFISTVLFALVVSTELTSVFCWVAHWTKSAHRALPWTSRGIQLLSSASLLNDVHVYRV